jgi:hypothetical protein
MDENDMTPEQISEIERLVEEVDRESDRVGVDWDVAAERLRALAQRGVEPAESDDISLGLDVFSLARTLRRLPNDAGTDAFLKAFEADEAAEAAEAEASETGEAGDAGE